jgi:hypothetical protein
MISEMELIVAFLSALLLSIGFAFGSAIHALPGLAPATVTQMIADGGPPLQAHNTPSSKFTQPTFTAPSSSTSSSPVKIDEPVTVAASSTEGELATTSLSAANIDWSIENAGTDPINGELLNKLSITISGRRYYIGLFDGNCRTADNDPVPRPNNMLTEISCDFTESGVGIAVFSEDAELS